MNKKERRDHIVQSAKELFVASGFHNTSIADIIDRAKIARSTFYQHFENKMDIFSLLVDSFTDILLQAILNINISKAEKQRDLAEEIRAMTVVLVRAIDDNKDLARLLITAPQGHDTSFDKKISDFYTQIIAAINTLLVEGIAGGTIKPLNPGIISFTILGNIKQVLIQWLVYGDIGDIYSVLDDVIKFNLYGIANR